MPKKMLIEQLNNLSKKQKEDLEIFANLPSNHINEKAKELFITLIQKSKLRRKLTEEQFVSEHFKDYSLQSWSKVKHDFDKTIQRYVKLKLIEQESFWGDYLLLKKFYYDDSIKNFNLLWNKVEKVLQANANTSAPTFLQGYFLYEIKAQKNREDIKIQKHLEAAESNLDNFFILEKLRMACESLNRYNQKKGKFYKLDENLEHFLLAKNEAPSIKISQLTYKLLKNPSNEDIYWELDEYLIKNEKFISFSKNKETREYLTNICANKLTNGTPSFVDSFYKNIIFLHSKKVLFTNNILNANHFLNFVTVSLILEDYDGLEEFIKVNEDKLHPHPDKETVIVLSKARLSFAKKEFDKCHELLVKIAPKNLSHIILYEKLFIKLFFKQNDIPACDNRTTSFKRKIKRLETISETHRKSILHFIECIEILCSGKEIDLIKFKPLLSIYDYNWMEKVRKT